MLSMNFFQQWNVEKKVKSAWNESSITKKIGFVGLSIVLGLNIRKLYDIFTRKLNKYAPGPSLGSLWLFDKYWYIASMANAYGPVFMMHLGGIDCVIITDAKIIRSALRRAEFCHHKKLHDVTGYHPQYELKYNDEYLRKRKMIHENFNIKLSNNYMNKMLDKICTMTIDKKYDKICTEKTLSTHNELANILKEPVFYLLFTSIFGEYVSFYDCVDDTQYHQFMDSLNAIFSDLEYSFVVKLILDSSPWTKKLLNLRKTTKTNENALMSINLVKKWYSAALTSYENMKNRNSDNSNCMISYMFDKKLNIHSDEMISDVLLVFFGVHTTGRSLLEATMLCALYPDIQDKLYKEIKSVNYRDYRDNNKLHLLRAFIHESLRVTTTGFFTGIARIIQDENVYLNGFHIRKNSVILPCYPYALHDDKYWKTGNQFDIHNFLDKNNKFKSNIAFTKFGIGKRDCPGVGITKKMLVSLFAKLILKYRFIATNNSKSKLPLWDGSGQYVRSLMQSIIAIEKRN